MVKEVEDKDEDDEGEGGGLSPFLHFLLETCLLFLHLLLEALSFLHTSLHFSLHKEPLPFHTSQSFFFCFCFWFFFPLKVLSYSNIPLGPSSCAMTI